MSRRTSGFSLIELMIATTILVAIVALLMQTFTTQNNTYVVVDQTTEAQQNSRIVADLIENDVRTAGYLVPKMAAACGIDATSGPDTIYLSNADVILPVDQLKAVDVDLVGGDLGATVTAATGASFTGNGSVLNIDKNYLDVAANGADFVVNGGVILVDSSDTNGRAICGTVRAVTANTLTVDFGAMSLGPVGAYATVRAVPAHVYRINAGNPSQLLRDGVVLANDVEDLQFALYFDANGNRNVDPGEYRGDGVGANYDPTAVNGSQLREIRLNVVVRTRAQDPNRAYQEGRRQALENRVLTAAENANDAANPGFRRRVHTSTVRLRNVPS